MEARVKKMRKVCPCCGSLRVRQKGPLLEASIEYSQCLDCRHEGADFFEFPIEKAEKAGASIRAKRSGK